jgi:hypothetical protein
MKKQDGRKTRTVDRRSEENGGIGRAKHKNEGNDEREKGGTREQ